MVDLSRPPPAGVVTPQARLAQRVLAHGGQPACLQKRHGVWRSWTWQELFGRTQCWAAALQGAGLRPGAAVAIVGGARAEMLVAEWACLHAGLVPVILNPALPPGGLATQALQAGATAFILEDQEQVDKVADLQTRLPALQGVWVIDAKGTRGYRHVALQALPEPQAATAAGPSATAAPATPEAPARMRLFTGGAAAEVRPVEVNLEGLDRLQATGAEMGLAEGTRVVSLFGPWSPLGHFVCVLAPLLYGSVICFGEDRLPSVAEWRECEPGVVTLPARALDRLRAETVARAQRSRGWRRRLFEAWLARSGGSAVWHALVGEPVARGLGLAGCQRVLTGFESLSPAGQAFLAAMRKPARSLYAVAECAGPVGHFDPLDRARLQLWPQVQGEVDGAGQLLLHADGGRWPTGDLATPQHPHWLHAGRAADQLRLADGQWLSPAVVELELLACPYVQQVVVVGGPSAGLTALVELDEAMLREWARPQGLVFTTTRSIAQSAAVQALIDEAVRAANARLPAAAQVARTVLLPRPLDPGNGELSPSLAVRRAVVRNRYAHRLVTGGPA